jgi:hypothetical protein
MRPRLLLVTLACLPGLASCYQFEVHAQAGYAQMSVDGDLGYVSTTGSTPVNFRQDVESAFGLGADQGTPYGRLSIDTGVPVITVSGFVFDESGEGTLTANFGENLTAGVPVRSDLEIASLKGSYLFQIDLGPVAISPGIAVDYFDLDVRVRDAIGIADERVELRAPVPLAMLRGEVDLGFVSALAEVGYMKVDVDDVEGSLLDLEAMLMLHPAPWLDIFAGYRSLTLEADGEIDGDAFDTDITISGFIIGGGLRF